ncbi:WD40 repeat domain-containing serine/threonine protein kinase [Urbifossiella limnaea]|uniref:Serine/threonine-protein kinase PknB n=1 Tax=Urbifossiella limnaea TaxID=2528023 RepID=A0A517Y1V2_9BACT|nr:WD40 repeat domain-containing serine/threonine protein kinase [Urbifossiella limnaea]QDU23736.1 Serine/threonine-protein kinase PknB [Urbifossiella limnaea]
MTHDAPSPGRDTLPAALLVLVEQLCDRFEDARRADKPVDLAALLLEAPEAARPALLRELLHLDLAYRPGGDRAAARAEYLARFPDYPAVVEDVFRGHREETAAFAPEGEATRWYVAAPADATRDAGADGSTKADHPAAADLPRVPGYAVEEAIGRGAMGVVYRARQLGLNRVVAIKTTRGPASDDPKLLIRFLAEAEAAAAVDHPHVARVYDFGQTGGRPFIALEYCPAGTLADRLAPPPETEGGGRTEWRLNPGVAAGLVAKIARGVAAAHDLGIVHRDLKPGNVLFDAAGEPKVADFGLAKVGGGSDLTHTHAVMGTPAYMAPEQAAGRTKFAGPAADVWSLGVVLYECLTGSRPFTGADTAEVLQAVASHTPPPPRAVNPAVPRDLDLLVRKCLEKDARDRYPTAAELADDLERFARGEPVSARPVGAAERAWKWARRNPGRAALVGLVSALGVAIMVGGVVASAVFRQQRDDVADKEKEVRTERDRVVAAEAEGREKLYQAVVAEARGTRMSRKIGQRWGALDAVTRARDVLATLDLPDAERARRRLDLRNEAIAALALPDVRTLPQWVTIPPGGQGEQYSWSPTPDGRFAAVCVKGRLSIRRIADDPERAVEVDHLDLEASIAFWSEDGRYLMVAAWKPKDRGENEKTVGVWIWDGVKLSSVIPPRPTNSIEIQYGFAPDGTAYIEANAGVVRTYELPSGRPLAQTNVAAQNYALTVALIPFHRTRPFAYLMGDRQVSIFDWKRGEVVGTTAAGIPTASSLVVHPDGDLLYVSTTGTVVAWSLAHNRERFRMPHDDNGMRLRLNPAGDVLMGNGWALRTHYWDPYTGHELFRHNGSGTSMILPDDRILGISAAEIGASRIQMKQFNPGREFRTLHYRDGSPTKSVGNPLSAHPGGRLLAVGPSTGTSLFDLVTGSERISGLSGAGASYFNAKGELFVPTTGRYAVWPTSTGETTATRFVIGPPSALPADISTNNIVMHSRDGTVVVGSNLEGGVVWHRATGRVVPLRPHADSRSSAVTPDGKLAATGSHSGTGIRIWNTDTGELLKEVLDDTVWTTPQFSPDGQWLTDWRGRRWRVGDWVEGPSLRSQPGMASRGSHAFDPTGNLIAVDAGDGVIVLLDSTGEKELARLTDPDQHAVDSMEFAPDGARLVTLPTKGRVLHVWDLRLIRERLKELALDWDQSPYPPAPPVDRLTPLTVEVEYGELGTLADRQQAESILNKRPRSTADPLPPAERAVRNAPKVPANRLVRGRAHARQRNSAEAVADFAEYLKLTGAKAKEYDLAAWHLVTEPGLSVEAYRQAREWAGKAVAAQPLNVPFLTCLGAAQFRDGDLKAAAATLRLAAAGGVFVERETAYAGYFLAMTQMRMARPGDAAARAEARKSFDTAETTYRKLTDRLPDMSDLRVEAAVLVGGNALRFELEIHDWSQKLKANPADGAARAGRALAYLRLGKDAEAEADYDAVIAAGGASDNPYHNRGHAREHQLKYAGAVEDYEAALQRTPQARATDRAHLLNEIARVRLLGGDAVRDPRVAVRAAAEAKELGRGIEVYKVTLGIAHARAGDAAAAVDALNGVEDDKVAPPAAVPFKYLFLALAYHQLGRSESAVASYDRAVTGWRTVPGSVLPEWRDYYDRTRAEVEKALGPALKAK